MNQEPKALATGPTKAMSSQDLAGFVALLFWMHDPTAAAYKPFPSFTDQVTGIQTALGNGTLPATKLIQNIQTMSIDPKIGPLIQAAQLSIGAMMKAMLASKDWDVCASVGMDLVAQITQL